MIVKINRDILVSALSRIKNDKIRRLRLIDNKLLLEGEIQTRQINCEFEGATVWYDTMSSSWTLLYEILKKISNTDIKLEIKTNYLDLIIELS